MTVLPLTYIGSTEWFSHLAGGDCVIDIGENWVKQTPRNRAEILTANGVATLTVPVHGYGRKIRTRDIRIDNSKRWQHGHWASLVSAYKNSPFFDHYEERFAPLYTTHKLNFLTDFNLELLNILTCILRLECRIEISEDYVVASPDDVDLRGKKALRRNVGEGIYISEKAESAGYLSQTPAEYPENSETPGDHNASRPFRKSTPAAYTQVFSDRMEFVPGLSVIDLVMCEGPAARHLL